MKKFKKNSVATTVAVLFTLGLAGIAMAVTPQPTVDLGGAKTFAILAGTPNITETGAHASAVTGDVGLDPAASSAIGLYCSQMIGLSKIFGVDTSYVGDGGGSATICFHGDAPGIAFVGAAKSALTNAYTDAASRIPVNTIDTELGGKTLLPGVYASGATTFGITAGSGHLILDGGGNPDAVFIFEASAASAGALTVGPGSVVELTGQAQACNVFWRVYGASINTTATFKGSILALTSITVASGADIEGRLLARNGNVTLDNAKIVVPTCVSAYTLHVFKQVVNTGGGTAVPSGFSLHVKLSGTDVTGSPQPGDSSGTSYSLVPSSTYVVSEDANASYTQSFSGDCDSSGSVTLAADGKTCTITNTYVPPVVHSSSASIASAPATLHVIKHVVNNGGGTATASSFAIHVKIPMVPVASDVIGSPAAGVEAPGTSYRLSVGTYTVSEDASTSYTHSFSGDCDSSGSVTLSTGADKTCTITNTYIRPVTTTTTTPALPNTGLPPQSGTPWDIFISAGILMLVSTSLVLALRKR